MKEYLAKFNRLTRKTFGPRVTLNLKTLRVNDASLQKTIDDSNIGYPKSAINFLTPWIGIVTIF